MENKKEDLTKDKKNLSKEKTEKPIKVKKKAKVKKNILHGIAYVKATFNNLFVTTTPTTGLKTQAGDFLTTEAGDFLVQE